jgi:hypothetical protein
MLWEFLDKLFSRTQTGSGSTSSRGELVEREISDWFKHHYSAGANWQDATFHCFADETQSAHDYPPPISLGRIR